MTIEDLEALRYLNSAIAAVLLIVILLIIAIYSWMKGDEDGA